MDNEERQPAPFNQQAALEELERFGRDIERYRAQREAIGEQFESFIRSFETPRPSPSAPVRPMPAPPQVPAAIQPIPEAAPATPVLEPAQIAAAPEEARGSALETAPVVSAAEPARPAPVATAPEPAIVAGAPVVRDRENAVTPAIVHDSDTSGDETAGAPVAASEPSAPIAATAAPVRFTALSPLLVGGALVAVLGGGILAIALWNRGGETVAPATLAPETPVAAPDPTPVPATPPPAAAIVAAPAESEITTIRHVWMRVTVDGQRVLEREVPAGTRVPLKAEQSIVIRTGDAGAVQLSIRGERRGFLGAEGEVVTRSFTVPPRAPAGRGGR